MGDTPKRKPTLKKPLAQIELEEYWEKSSSRNEQPFQDSDSEYEFEESSHEDSSQFSDFEEAKAETIFARHIE
ncbi:hypothetical protein QE152_g23754 [Popillia japonica]|uniref:Uncharacterized protein n=1 Tax=Popillia japonica TaxID=7064 RepID=A0AAW1KHD8_POPJA